MDGVLLAHIPVEWIRINPGVELTEEQKQKRAALARENRSFQIVSDEEALLRDMLDWSQPRDQWRELTASAICNLLGSGGRLSPVRIGRALRKIGYSKDSAEFPIRGRGGHPRYLVPCCAAWGSPQIEIK